MTTPIETDVLVVGAGPVGLYQVFQLGLLELSAQVVDSLPSVGGQCVELYADKPIYDIPALPSSTARELIERLQRQIEPFGTPFHLRQQVSSVALRADGRFDVATSRDTSFAARAIVIAGGVGSFQPRRLKLEGLDRFRDTQLFESAEGTARVAGRRIVVVGAGAAAVAAALAAVDAGAASVTVVHRRDEFDASTGDLKRFAQRRAEARIEVVAGVPVAVASTVPDKGAAHLDGLVIACHDGTERTIVLDLVFVLLGWSPRLGPIAEWGLALERKQLVVDTERFETSTPGIHAVGDVNVYPGKKKLIVCGFHEATLAAYAISARLHPDRQQPLQYTTTSPKLHRLLGVAPQV